MFVLLENSIYEELVKLSDEFEVKENVNNINFNGNIAEVETFLNTSLYSDEAMIYYLCLFLNSFAIGLYLLTSSIALCKYEDNCFLSTYPLLFVL